MSARTPTEPLRVAFIGWGAIATAAAGYLADDPIRIVAAAVRDPSTPRTSLPDTATVITDPRGLAAAAPHVVVEAAGRAAVGPWGRAALGAGVDFIVSSVSAFADPALLEELGALAKRHRAQLQISPGALAGIDALSAARVMGVETVEHRMVKPPRAWRGTPAEDLCELHSIAEPTPFFTADAATTAARFPKNANVAMTTALAGVGPERTTIVLVADPAATTNRHEITARGAFGSLQVAIANNPLPANAKTSAMAALSLVRALRNRVTAVTI